MSCKFGRGKAKFRLTIFYISLGNSHCLNFFLYSEYHRSCCSKPGLTIIKGILLCFSFVCAVCSSHPAAVTFVSMFPTAWEGVFPLIPQRVTLHMPSSDFFIIEQFQIVTASTWFLVQDKGWFFSQFYVHWLRRIEAHDPLKQAQSQTHLVMAVHSEACAQGWGSLNLPKQLQKFCSLRIYFLKKTLSLYNSVDKEARLLWKKSEKKWRSTKKSRNVG